ncbi:hypothetical protein [Synechococcus sp. MU1651]|uniref:hypothetical protein n=1 Tax=Synechococcus sp. MU1651 TaxID=2508353 RepID=UPI002025EBD5|nr:hypothetical protein [Synechococcus sp. MU1651]
MKPVVSLLAASTVGLNFVFADANQASNAEAFLMARTDPRDKSDNDRDLIDRSQVNDGSGKNTWIPFGYNNERVAVFWGRVSTYKPLNENSFRIQVQYNTNNGRQMEGRMDVNCKNKDYYIRPNGVFAQNAPWAVIPKGSGVQVAATFFCRRTAAKAEWGYTESTKYIWDAPAPIYSPDQSSGEWVQFLDRADGQGYYNDDVKKEGDVITFAMWTETIKGDMSTDNQDVQRYDWIRSSCKKNLGSSWFVLDPSVEGIWLPPQPGRPGGAGMTVRKRFCN